jgi:hypothetical protein
MKIKLLRNIAIKGEHCPSGKVVEVEEPFGREMVAIGKAMEHKGDDPKPKSSRSRDD